ncbi:MAG: hypothetical protein BJ554DRAFT_2814 [Olpidium bornovanus]|uniref:Uncharacterized protein n=1 Tax=Olpidium bornovanus TaxID=278681 RepID=A0A8H7ZPY0_9FUNG|nr:MAG: hypothetical protein BJ554DRAFT_2814 [Olpidium bornovanus]
MRRSDGVLKRARVSSFIFIFIFFFSDWTWGGGGGAETTAPPITHNPQPPEKKKKKKKKKKEKKKKNATRTHTHVHTLNPPHHGQGEEGDEEVREDQAQGDPAGEGQAEAEGEQVSRRQALQGRRMPGRLRGRKKRETPHARGHALPRGTELLFIRFCLAHLVGKHPSFFAQKRPARLTPRGSRPRFRKRAYKDMDVDSFLAGGFEAAAESDAGDSDEDEVLDEQEDRRRGSGAGEEEEEEEESRADEVLESEGDGGGAEEGSVLDDDGENLDEHGDEDEHSDEDDVARHKRQLEDLKQVDPDFYKYLQENDQELLDFDFDGESEDSGEEDEEGSDGEGGADRAAGARDKKAERKEKATKETREITNDVLDRWQKNVVEVRFRGLTAFFERSSVSRFTCSNADCHVDR